MKKKLIGLIFAALLGMSLMGCGEDTALDDVTIVYTNDSHGHINNMITDEDGNEQRGLSFASVAAYVKEKRSNGENVILVDAGDHIQGTAYCGMDEGASIINIMNTAGYQVACIGNHEFDYGQFRFFQMVEQADFPYISCNFYSTEDNSTPLPAYEVIEAGNAKIAFVGVSTPETYTKSCPTYFQNEKGEFIYGFYAGDNGQELYDAVQKTIDEAQKEADYVIGLCHLGVDTSSSPYTSYELISNTTGFDAVIDGHSHTVMEAEKVTDAGGNTVILTQTGSFLNAIGNMTISKGVITCQLVTEYDGLDEETAKAEDDWIKVVDDQLNTKIAVSDVNLYQSDPDDNSIRLVRMQETNLGDFITDAVYWYINEKTELDCDIAISNGGAHRSNILEGDVSYFTAKNVNPYGNCICLVEATGQQIKDALEMGARFVGVTDNLTGLSTPCGGFLQVSGLKYTIDSSVESTLGVSEEGLFVSSPTGAYKVSDIEVYNKETKVYEPIDLDAVYTLGGSNYTIRNKGDGMAMLADSKLVLDFIAEDYLCTAAYITAFDGADEEGFPHISTANSPLSSYEGYLMDYENLQGSGRILIK